MPSECEDLFIPEMLDDTNRIWIPLEIINAVGVSKDAFHQSTEMFPPRQHHQSGVFLLELLIPDQHVALNGPVGDGHQFAIEILDRIPRQTVLGDFHGCAHKGIMLRSIFTP